MLLSFFQNACILIAFMSFVQHLFKDKFIFQNPSLSSKIVFGFCSGILGIILMLNSVRISPDQIIDFRYIPILLSAVYSGFLSSITASFVIGVFRLFYFGISKTSIIALIDALLMGAGFGIIALLKLPQKREYICAMLYFSSVSFISTLITLKDSQLIIHTLTIFLSGYLIVSYISIKYADYIIETVKIYEKLKNEAAKDYLTGLNNVRQFDKSFSSISQMTVRKEEELSLLIIDIDFFKKVNDTYGHDVGDKVLKSLAPILLDTCRAYDVVSRNGGEEFSILLLDCSASKAVKIAERLRKNVEKNDFHISVNKSINITISIGISSYPELTGQIDNLYKDADIALYEAKHAGRNKVVLFNN